MFRVFRVFDRRPGERGVRELTANAALNPGHLSGTEAWSRSSGSSTQHEFGRPVLADKGFDGGQYHSFV